MAWLFASSCQRIHEDYFALAALFDAVSMGQAVVFVAYHLSSIVSWDGSCQTPGAVDCDGGAENTSKEIAVGPYEARELGILIILRFPFIFRQLKPFYTVDPDRCEC